MAADDTREIADSIPQIIYHHQPNHGFSVARNVGARLVTGEIVAYTDSDCVVTNIGYGIWPWYPEPKVEAIGGPTSPASDGSIAKCVAVSPGNPSHVMLDDRYADLSLAVTWPFIAMCC